MRIVFVLNQCIKVLSIKIKIMKKLIVCLLFTAVLVLSKTEIFAQGGGGGNRGQMREMMKQRLKDSVGLNDVQIDTVMAIREEMQPKMREAMSDQSMSADDKKSKMDEMRKEMYDRFAKAGLTDDQVKKIKEMDERMRQQMRNRKN